MEIPPISNNAVDPQLNQTARLNQDDFIKLFMSQLKAQDPMEPVNNQDFLAQMAQFSLLEATRVTNSKLDGIVDIVENNQAASLIGKNVDVKSFNSVISGEVISASFRNSETTLTVKARNESGEEYYLRDIPIHNLLNIN